MRVDSPHIARSPAAPDAGRSRYVTGLPGEYYWQPQLYEDDLAKVFLANWLFIAHVCEIPQTGDYLTFSLGRDSVIVVRDKDGSVRAFFNSCRHRGSILCDQERGNTAKFVCPYHSWVYGLDGALEQCRLMGDEVRKSDFPLHRAHVEVVHGFIFVCLAPMPPSFAPAADALSRFIAPHAQSDVKVCLQLDYVVAANWKTIFDNNRECYHCASSHREFCLSNFDYGMPGDSRASAEFVAANDRMQRRWSEFDLEVGPVNFPDGQWYRCMRFPLKQGYVTESLDGCPVAPLIGDFPDHDVGSLRIVGLPNMWFHLNSDYFMTTRLLPTGPAETRARVVWYVRADAVEGRDYHPDRVADVWRLTSEQDWKLCENNQRGLQCSRYVPGPLSQIAEQGVASFAAWYLGQLARHADTTPPDTNHRAVQPKSVGA